LKKAARLGAAMAGRSVVLVHGHCADGLTSAALLRRALPETEVRAVAPADVRAELEELANDATIGRLVLADLSPQSSDGEATLAALRRLRERGPVTWIDHHAPQWSHEFEAAVRAADVEVVLDRTGTESGASLSAAWAKEADPRLLRVADLIRRRDAWVDPHHPEARAWTLAAVDVGDYVDRVAAGDLDGLEEVGRQLLQVKEASIAASLIAVERFTPRVAYLWGEDDVSDVADRLFQQDAEAVLLLRFGPSRRVSIRSRAGWPLAAPLAQAFGGGGHANAAGFTLRLGLWQRVGYRVRRGRHASVRAALAAAERLAREGGLRARP
jgi:oligoribonuclease NrnB/cAMP/cGMP phosphodiesterase (DHH superfamily)